MASMEIDNTNPVHVNTALDSVFEPIKLTFGLAVQLVKTWSRRQAERDQLARLSERDLRDLGVTRASAAYEFEKPFWRA